MTDFQDIHSLFSNEIDLPNYIDKKLNRYDPEQPPPFSDGKTVKFNFREDVDKFLCYHEGYLMFDVAITRTGFTDAGTILSFKNSHAFLSKCIVKINNVIVETLEYQYILMDILNAIEYSHDHSKMLEGSDYFLNDVGTDNNPLIIAGNSADTLRKRCHNMTVNNTVLNTTFKLPFKNIANIFRSLNFPIINNENSFEITLRTTNAVFRTDGEDFAVTVSNLAAYVPQVILPTKYEAMYLEKKPVKSFTWYDCVVINENFGVVAANATINRQVNANIEGVKKLFVFATTEALADFAKQKSRDSTSTARLENVNIVINNTNFYKNPITNQRMLYEEIKSFFNGGGGDPTTGPLLSFSNFNTANRYYCFDLKRQKDFEIDPRKNQQIRFLATNVGAAINLVFFFLMKERTCTIDLTNSVNTKPNY